MASILIASFLRSKYLYHHLASLLFQETDWSEHEIIVLNDGVEDATQEVCRYYQGLGLPVRYLFTGQRNREGMQWRVPGYTWNIGIQESDSEIVVLSCAEMFHVSASLDPIVKAVKRNSRALGTPYKINEDKGELIQALELHKDIHLPIRHPEVQQAIKESYWLGIDRTISPFRPHSDMPFWMAVARKNLLEIGGFDEDFTGVACEDSDLMNRLLAFGCYYHKVGATVIHLNHGTRKPEEIFADPRYKYNCELMEQRSGQIVRNVGRKWGVLTE